MKNHQNFGRQDIRLPIDPNLTQALKGVCREVDTDQIVTTMIDETGEYLIIDAYPKSVIPQVSDKHQVYGGISFRPGYYIRGLVKRDNAVLAGGIDFATEIDGGIIDYVMMSFANALGDRHDFHLSLITPPGDALYRISLLNEPQNGYRAFKARTADLLTEGTFCFISDERGFVAIPGEQIATFIGRDSCPPMRVSPPFKPIEPIPGNTERTLPYRAEDVAFINARSNHTMAVTCKDGTMEIFNVMRTRDSIKAWVLEFRSFMRFRVTEGCQEVARFIGQVGRDDVAVVVSYLDAHSAQFAFKVMKEI